MLSLTFHSTVARPTDNAPNQSNDFLPTCMSTPYLPPEMTVFYEPPPPPNVPAELVFVKAERHEPFGFFENFYSEPPMANKDHYPSPVEMYTAKEFEQTWIDYQKSEPQLEEMDTTGEHGSDRGESMSVNHRYDTVGCHQGEAATDQGSEYSQQGAAQADHSGDRRHDCHQGEAATAAASEYSQQGAAHAAGDHQGVEGSEFGAATSDRTDSTIKENVDREETVEVLLQGTLVELDKQDLEEKMNPESGNQLKDEEVSIMQMENQQQTHHIHLCIGMRSNICTNYPGITMTLR